MTWQTILLVLLCIAVVVNTATLWVAAETVSGIVRIQTRLFEIAEFHGRDIASLETRVSTLELACVRENVGPTKELTAQ